MAYQIRYTAAAERAIRKLERPVQARILRKLDTLSENPRGSDSIKLVGHDTYRTRVGDYRIVYQILDDRLLVIVLDAGHRREIYRDW